MKVPGPDHPIAISAHPRRVQVTFGGHLIADTRRALALKEADHPPVLYIPRADIEMSVLARTDHHTHCPYKGDASYFTISRDGQVAENAVWSYEHPLPALAQIAGHLAFHPDQVAFEELDGPDPAERMREVIEHTDTGAGTSQLEHWPASEE